MKKEVVIILFSCLVLLFFFNRGFAYYDEGFILHAAQRVLQGEMPYKDYDLIYTPGTIFLTAAVFKIFGESILTGRILMLLIGLLTSYLVYAICRKVVKNDFISFLAVLVYLAWGPTHINFPWPTSFALTAGLGAMLAIPNYFIAGFLTFTVFFMKQNFGAAVFLAIFIFIGIKKSENNLPRFLSGLFLGGLIFLIYLLFTGSLKGFGENFYFYTLKSFLLNGAGSTPFPSGVKVIFYLLPLIISLGTVVLLRNKKNMLGLPLFTLFFYLFGIRPTTDFVHLSTLMAICGIPLTLIVSEYRRLRNFTIIFLLLLSLGGFYTALFKNYYRWDSPLIRQNNFLAGSKSGIFVDQKFGQVIPDVIKTIRLKKAGNDYIFVYPNAPAFYFLSSKKNPTRLINLPGGLHTVDQEREVVDQLKLKKVQLILTNDPLDVTDYPVITGYIRQNYLKKKVFFEFTVWEKLESGKRSEVRNK